MEIIQYFTDLSANGLDALEFLFFAAKNLFYTISTANVPDWFPVLCSLGIGTAILIRKG